MTNSFNKGSPKLRPELASRSSASGDHRRHRCHRCHTLWRRRTLRCGAGMGELGPAPHLKCWPRTTAECQWRRCSPKSERFSRRLSAEVSRDPPVPTSGPFSGPKARAHKLLPPQGVLGGAGAGRVVVRCASSTWRASVSQCRGRSQPTLIAEGLASAEWGRGCPGASPPPSRSSGPFGRCGTPMWRCSLGLLSTAPCRRWPLSSSGSTAQHSRPPDAAAHALWRSAPLCGQLWPTSAAFDDLWKLVEDRAGEQCSTNSGAATGPVSGENSSAQVSNASLPPQPRCPGGIF